ncbi:MAG: hypothetical protein M5U08_25415 [Burkholderiales bacterium]|nr:hypothetical protein [Burkholderiales bacterium]
MRLLPVGCSPDLAAGAARRVRGARWPTESHVDAGAGHVLNCDEGGSGRADPARLAGERPVAFLRRHIDRPGRRAVESAPHAC